jgi:hypothetical protein
MQLKWLPDEESAVDWLHSTPSSFGTYAAQPRLLSSEEPPSEPGHNIAFCQ